MNASFVLDSSELNYAFIDKLREMFQNKRIELFITEMDDTEYLSRSTVNKKLLLESIANIHNNQNLVTVDAKLFT
ncbi:MAG: hypothetical protein WA080_01675 [Sulfuricurvum sp.]|jgi:antitoxin YefM